MTKYQNKSMKVTTVNIPKSYIKHLRVLMDKEDFKEYFGFEPSLSECVRHALKDFIMKNYELGDYLRGFNPKARELRKRELKENLENILIQVPRQKRKSLGRHFEDYNSKGLNEE